MGGLEVVGSPTVEESYVSHPEGGLRRFLNNPHLAQELVDHPVARPTSGGNEQRARSNIKTGSVRFGDGGRSTENLADLVISLSGTGKCAGRYFPDACTKAMGFPDPQIRLSLA